MLYKSLLSLSLASVALAHGDHSHDQEPMSGPHQGLWYNTLPGDGGTQVRVSTRLVANQTDKV
jgi:agmatinase